MIRSMNKHPLLVLSMMFLFVPHSVARDLKVSTVKGCREYSDHLDMEAGSVAAIDDVMGTLYYCGRLDPAREDKYDGLYNIFYGEKSARMLHFLYRHDDLMKQFLAEDAKGLR